ncbi:cGMP-dependent protein kinase 1-like isoform X2 [Clavelina lepadiformis]|uniref:cGMP-dependent protein kinase n=1 Tax=Clavelina lepadiformis TaxID=159417 RepID=A0ABP0F715_CLALP
MPFIKLKGNKPIAPVQGTYTDGTIKTLEKDISNLKKQLENAEIDHNKTKQSLEDLKNEQRKLEKKLIEKNKKIAQMQEILSSIGQSEKFDAQAPEARKKKRRKAVDGGRVQVVVDAKKTPKSPEQIILFKQAIKSNEILGNLTDEQMNEMIAYMKRSFPPNGVYVKEGTKGDRLYILETGEVEVTKENKFIRTMKSGSVFGELALMYNCKRTATVTAKGATKVWMLERNIFQMVMMNTTRSIRAEIAKALKKVPLLQNMSKGKLLKIIDALEEEKFHERDYIIRQGEDGDTFYIVMEGEVDVTTRDRNGAETYKRTLGKGDYFGEAALLNDSGKRGANVVVKSSVVKCMILEKKPFLSLIGSLAEITYDLPQHLNNNKASTASTTSTRRSADLQQMSKISILDLPTRPSRPSLVSTSLKDLEKIGTLGVGGFGRVDLVKLKTQDHRTFALKRMKKAYIVETKQQDHIISEKIILRDTNNPFIIQLYQTFKDKKFVYMLMEACLGGELWTKLRDDRYFGEKQAKFYTACVVEAIEYLHVHGIVFRDLKPENLLLDKKGYVKLVDFGFAKRLYYGEKTWTFCGTPDYVPPELILNKGHDYAVDYWALGILIFEMLTGNPPFSSSEPMQVYKKALNGIDGIHWPIFYNNKKIVKKSKHKHFQRVEIHLLRFLYQIASVGRCRSVHIA